MVQQDFDPEIAPQPEPGPDEDSDSCVDHAEDAETKDEDLPASYGGVG